MHIIYIKWQVSHESLLNTCYTQCHVDNGYYEYGHKRQIGASVLTFHVVLHLALHPVEDNTEEYNTMIAEIPGLEVKKSLSRVVQAPAQHTVGSSACLPLSLGDCEGDLNVPESVHIGSCFIALTCFKSCSQLLSAIVFYCKLNTFNIKHCVNVRCTCYFATFTHNHPWGIHGGLMQGSPMP